MQGRTYITSTHTEGRNALCSERALKSLGAVCKHASASWALRKIRYIRTFGRGPDAVLYQLPC